MAHETGLYNKVAVGQGAAARLRYLSLPDVPRDATSFYDHVISTEPTRGDYSTYSSVFTGDLTHLAFPIRYHTEDTALGTPDEGVYQYTFEAYPVVIYILNESGTQGGIGTGVGRTAMTASMVKMTQAGQGDGIAYWALMSVGGDTVTGTWEVQKTAGILSGQIQAYGDGVNAIPLECHVADSGYDLGAVFGLVFNLNRTNDTAAYGGYWIGTRITGTGTKPIDGFYTMAGHGHVGIDFTQVTFQSSGTYIQAAALLKAGQRIYFNATTATYLASATGAEYIGGIGGGAIHIQGSVTLQPNEDNTLGLNLQPTATGVRSQLWFSESSGTNHVGFTAATSISSDVVWTLPAADGSANQVLKTNGSATLAFDYPRLKLTSAAADPTTTEFAASGDHGIHKNTTSGNVFLAYNDGGAIKKVQLT